MTQELNLDDLLAQQKIIEDQIKEARKEKKDQAIKDVVSIIKKYAISIKDLSGAFGYLPPEEPLKKRVKKVYGKAEPKWQYVLNGVKITWAGRGNPKTFPQTLKDYLNEKKITIEQFKADPKHKIAV